MAATKPTDKTSADSPLSDEANWWVDLIDGTGVANANMKLTAGTDNSGIGFEIVNASTGVGAKIDQDGNGIAFEIDSEATSTKSIKVEAQVSGNDQVIYIRNNAAQSGASAGVLYVVQEHASSSAEAVNIKNDGTGEGLLVDANGTGNGVVIDYDSVSSTSSALLIDYDGGSGCAIEIDSTRVNHGSSQHWDTDKVVRTNTGSSTGATTGAARYTEVVFNKQDTHADTTIGHEIIMSASGTGRGIFVSQNGNGEGMRIQTAATTEEGILLYSNAVYTGTALGVFKQDNASATGGVFQVVNDGTGIGLSVDQNGNSTAVHVDTEGTDSIAVHIEPDALVEGAGLIVDTAASGFTGANYGGLVQFKVDHPSATGKALYVRTDSNTGGAVEIEVNTAAATGTALLLDHNGNGKSLAVSSSATTSDVLDINCNGLTTGGALLVYSNTVTSGYIANFQNNNAGSSAPAIFIGQASSSEAIEFSGGTDTTTGGTTQVGRVKVKIGGATRYLHYYSD